MVEVTGLEPAASASRTQRSTKLSHTSINKILNCRESKWLGNRSRCYAAYTCGAQNFMLLGAEQNFDRGDFSHSLFLPQEALVFKATKLSHTSINNKSKY